jgi:EAL domain-containing protein (putative c-di-GMP-specific phosphodiesterase class I)
VKVALDDFGTGFASLTHLLTVPVDIIKIDRSFVARLVPNGASAAIIEGVSMIANKLGMRLLAEGIEKEMQAAQICNFGCVLGQGFLYSPAVDRSAMTDLVLRHAQGSGRPLRADDHQPPSAASVARRR